MEISLKKVYGWQMKIGNDAEHHDLLGKCKVKPQWDIITHTLGWIK